MKLCKLIVKDEVNVKLEGLDIVTRKKLVNKFKFQLPYARHLPSVRLGRWDGCVNFFQLGGSTYLNLLPEIFPILEQDGYDIELVDQRVNQDKCSFEPVTETSYEHVLWPEGHPNENESILLRDHQVEVINKFLEHPQGLQEVATGAGKTIITAALSQRAEKYGRSIVIVPNKSLVGQTETDYINLGLDTGVFYGDRKDYGNKHIICTWQSLNSLLKKTKNKDDIPITIDEFIDGVACVIVDEVHGLKADALKALMTGPLRNVPIRWGLTGTIPKEKHDFYSLLCCIGDVVNSVAASELQDKGILAKCHVNIIQSKEYREFQNYHSEAKFLLEDEERNDWLAEQIKAISQDGNTLVLVDRIAPGKELVKKLENSIDIVYVSGAVKVSDRKTSYDSINTSQNKVIVATYGVAAVGINIPRIFNLVLIEPGKSFVRVIQSIGRGIRIAKDKDFAQIWDITSNTKYSKRHLTQRKTFYKEAGYPFTIEKVER